LLDFLYELYYDAQIHEHQACGLLWQYETTLLWTGKELTGNKIPYRS